MIVPLLWPRFAGITCGHKSRREIGKFDRKRDANLVQGEYPSTTIMIHRLRKHEDKLSASGEFRVVTAFMECTIKVDTNFLDFYVPFRKTRCVLFRCSVVA